MNPWEGDFGRAYTDRNPQSARELNDLYLKDYGKAASDLYREFFGLMPRHLRILEIGCNVGCQLEVLGALGFQDLWGLDIQWYAIEKARDRLPGVNLLQWDVKAGLPFKDGFFDLIFTAGLLIHIPQEALPALVQEMQRCSKRYIWGFECFSEKRKEIIYRGHKNMMWVDDFACWFDWSVVKIQKVRYLHHRYKDEMYLLEKP